MLSPPDRPATLGSADAEQTATRLELSAQSLASDEAVDACFELVEPGFMGVRTPRGRVAVLDVQALEPLRWQLNLERIARGAYPATLVLVLGGGAEVRERLLAAARTPATSRLWLACSDGGEPWQSRPPTRQQAPLCRALERSAREASERTTWGAAEAEALYRRLQHDLVRARDEARQLDQFRARLLGRRPIVTTALIGIVLVVFALQALWGGVDLPPLLPRMGSLLPERARAGEWWRYFACTFLHGGVLHAGLNMLVLWMLGRSLERFIGSARFMLIYFAAGLAGSVTSSLFVSQSVGASGAIWGLLGAEAAMAFYPRPLLPPTLIGIARRSAAANLGLQLFNSFLPHVDWAAHLGGGLMGALVLVLLALSGQLSEHGRPPAPLAAWLRGLAGILAAVFLVGLVTAQLKGQPWRLDTPPELERVPLAGSPWTISVPRMRSAADPGDEGDATFGNLSFDPSVIDIGWDLAQSRGAAIDEPVTDDTTRRILAAIQHRLERAPEGLEIVVPPHLVTEGSAAPYVSVRYRYAANTELVDDRVVGMVDGAMVRVSVIAWAALPAAFDGLAPRVLASIEPVR